MKRILRFTFGVNGKETLIVSKRMPGESIKDHVSRALRTWGAMVEISCEKNKNKHNSIFEKYQL